MADTDEATAARRRACHCSGCGLHTQFSRLRPSQVVDVGVIDEIQLIADEDRGWAWTRALFGLPAREVHLCGDASALPTEREAAAALGEELEERVYERFNPLMLQTRSLEGDYSAVQPGDAVIAFSRKGIFAIRASIEAATGRRCAVIYGGLPPETRRKQAALFNDPTSGYDVLVASDAVGLGLNLNIRRVVFHSLHRTRGRDGAALLQPAEVKQIAGRAGRRGSRWEASGLAAAFFPEDVSRRGGAERTGRPVTGAPTPSRHCTLCRWMTWRLRSPLRLTRRAGLE